MTAAPAPASTARILFQRNPSLVEAMRRAQSPGRCCLTSCRKPLPKGRRLWCSPRCYGEAYRTSVLFDWQRVRDEILERDKMTCQKCGRAPLTKYREGPKEDWAEVDHVVGVAERPDLQFERENLRTLCHRCHAEKTTADRSKAAGATESFQSDNKHDGPKVEAVFTETPPIPKKVAQAAKADLLRNMTIPQVAQKYQLDMNGVKGLWSALKAAMIIPEGVKPGELVLVPATQAQQPAQAAQPAPQARAVAQAQESAQSTGPVYAYPALPQAGPTGAPATQSQVVVASPTGGPPIVLPTSQPVQRAQPATPVQPQLPAYEVVKTSNGFPDQPRPAIGGVPTPLEATGFVTKVYQNPKNLLWYDFFKEKHRAKMGKEWEGDFADFISDCIEYMFKSQGYEVVIRQTTRLA